MNALSKLICLFAVALPLTTLAYPPAPHHTIYGMVRDQFGTPIQADNAYVILETAGGAKIQSQIRASGPGANYSIQTPMDAGITTDLYVPTALKPTVPFKIRVKIGNATYLPLEMAADFSHLGEPGAKTLLNLTLGEDSDGDGLPDAWERALIGLTGGGRGLSDITPSQDTDGDGLSNVDEYLAGTYAFDPKNGFALKLVGFGENGPHLDFTVVRGHTYIVYGSNDLNTWTQINFRIPADGANAPYLAGYSANDVRLLRIEAHSDAAGENYAFFKLMVQ